MKHGTNVTVESHNGQIGFIQSYMHQSKSTVLKFAEVNYYQTPLIAMPTERATIDFETPFSQR